MTYIVQRQHRFYVVAYDGLDPLTGRDRRRWHPVGHDRAEATAIAARLDAQRESAPPPIGGPIPLGTFLTETWLPQKRRHVRATTAYRYAWFVDRSINPAIGDIALRAAVRPSRSALRIARGRRRSRRHRLGAQDDPRSPHDHDLPDDDRVDVSIAMRQQIPHVNDLTQWDLRVTVPKPV
jgi:hypothetical protein